MIRCSALSAVALFVPVLACAGQAARYDILELARSWSRQGSSLKCEPIPPGKSGIDDQVNPQHCAWRRTAAGGAVLEEIEAGVDRGGGPSLVSWQRMVSDNAEAARVIDSLHTALTGIGLRRHECGTSARPGGADLREILWEGDRLLLFLMRVAPRDSLPRVMILASDDPATMPRPTLCHLRDAPDAMWPLERGEAPNALRAEMVLDMVPIQLVRDSILAIIQYRTNTPARDSASVRRTLTERLARRNSMFYAQHLGVVPSRTTRLVIRPCYTDACPPLGSGIPLIAGDLEFAMRADSSWAPSERRGVRRD